MTNNPLDQLDQLNNLDQLDTMQDFGQTLETNLADLDALDQPGLPNPRDNHQATGDLQEDVIGEANELLAGFKARAKAEDERMRLATDSEYWTVLCFQSREQAIAFSRAMRWGDGNDKYLDGFTVAKRMGIDLEAVDVPYNTSDREDRKLMAITIPTTVPTARPPAENE